MVHYADTSYSDMYLHREGGGVPYRVPIKDGLTMIQLCLCFYLTYKFEIGKVILVAHARVRIYLEGK